MSTVQDISSKLQLVEELLDHRQRIKNETGAVLALTGIDRHIDVIWTASNHRSTDQTLKGKSEELSHSRNSNAAATPTLKGVAGLKQPYDDTLTKRNNGQSRVNPRVDFHGDVRNDRAVVRDSTSARQHSRRDVSYQESTCRTARFSSEPLTSTEQSRWTRHYGRSTCKSRAATTNDAPDKAKWKLNTSQASINVKSAKPTDLPMGVRVIRGWGDDEIMKTAKPNDLPSGRRVITGLGDDQEVCIVRPPMTFGKDLELKWTEGRTAPGGFGKLPLEVRTEIYELLDSNDSKHLEQTCKTLGTEVDPNTIDIDSADNIYIMVTAKDYV